jgi:serine/threonine protein kinase
MNETTHSMLGKVIHQYRVLEKINDGAFGTVFLGEHLNLKGIVVAVKVLHTIYLNSQEQCDAFLQEANLLAMLNHPHILKVLDSGMYQGRPYIISDFARGGTLRDRLQRSNGQPLPTSEAIKILSQVGLGLQYAQSKGLIHRDIKPENILFNENGDALLADFNISVVSTQTSSVKNVDATGTPPYMAPEQFKGMVSKESDQYALGVVAYELFTGRRPFYGPDFIALATAHDSQPPLPLGQINPDIPEHIEIAVLKTLEKNR